MQVANGLFRKHLAVRRLVTTVRAGKLPLRRLALLLHCEGYADLALHAAKLRREHRRKVCFLIVCLEISSTRRARSTPESVAVCAKGNAKLQLVLSRAIAIGRRFAGHTASESFALVVVRRGRICSSKSKREF